MNPEESREWILTFCIQLSTMEAQMNSIEVNVMASSVLQVRVDESLRTQAAAIYEDLGIDLQTAVRIFLKRSVREKGLPFGMTLNEERDAAIESGIKAIRSMRDAAEEAGLSGMSLDEINAEIAAARSARRAMVGEGR